jgi:hypothetical protein
MDFVAVMDQVIALLRQRGRLTYRTLQRQFQLDEVALEDLKEELIYGQRLALDEDGRVLVWTGETGIPCAGGRSARRDLSAHTAHLHAFLSRRKIFMSRSALKASASGHCAVLGPRARWALAEARGGSAAPDPVLNT